jgi:hypothetical protein
MVTSATVGLTPQLKSGALAPLRSIVLCKKILKGHDFSRKKILKGHDLSRAVRKFLMNRGFNSR